MKDWTNIKTRYLQDDSSTRLGGLAANLARVSSFSKNPANRDAVFGLLDESKYFIEWVTPDVEIEIAAELVDLQLQLAMWQNNWQKIWADPVQRVEIAGQSKHWSERILEVSGLLN